MEILTENTLLYIKCCQLSARRLCLTINGKDLFQGLKICKSETQLGNTQSSEEERKAESSYSKKYS